MMRFVVTMLVSLWLATGATAQSGPLRIEITDGVIEPLTYAIPAFEAETLAAGPVAEKLTRVIAADLSGSGLFRELPASSFVAQRRTFSEAVRYADWRAINAQALITGAVSVDGGGKLTVKFRVFDIFSGKELGKGLQLAGSANAVRRMAHKVADQVYTRITGEGPYFDSKVVFVSEKGPKDNRRKRLAVMDYDGANVQFLTDSSSLVFAPRISKDGRRILYTSYESGFPQIYLMDLASVQRRVLPTPQGAMAFSPRFSPGGDRVVYSLEMGGNTDIFLLDVASARSARLTNAPSIETAPSFSPDGRRIVFESDRSGTQQLYTMPISGGEPKRISFGKGRYGSPVWSPRGDLIAFTKQTKGRFGIGVMRVDGSDERLLSASFLDDGPTWSPNGRVVMFTRETQGASGAAGLYSVDITGRNLRSVKLSSPASDPTWGPVQ